jgi:hypothetical protein
MPSIALMYARAAGPGLDRARRPRVAEHHAAGAECHLPKRGSPVGGAGIDRDHADHGVDYPVEKVVFVAHVGVEGHCLDPQLLREPAHADGVDAVPVGEFDGGRHHLLPRQLSAAFRARLACVGELHVSAPWVRCRFVLSKQTSVTSMLSPP